MPPRDDEEMVELEGAECTAETAMALLVSVGGQEIWMPKSQIALDSEIEMKGDVGRLVVTRWIAEQKGLV